MTADAPPSVAGNQNKLRLLHSRDSSRKLLRPGSGAGLLVRRESRIAVVHSPSSDATSPSPGQCWIMRDVCLAVSFTSPCFLHCSLF